MKIYNLNQAIFAGTITLNKIRLNYGFFSAVLSASMIMMIYCEGCHLASLTPWVGAREQINILAFLIWMAVLAIILLRKIQKTNNAVTGPQAAVFYK
jgi:hypothetical protein